MFDKKVRDSIYLIPFFLFLSSKITFKALFFVLMLGLFKRRLALDKSIFSAINKHTSKINVKAFFS